MKCLWILAQRWFSEIYLVQLEAPAPCPSSRSKAVTARCAVARPLGPSGVLRQRRRCNADGEVPLIRSLLASLLYAAEVHGFGSCPMSDWIRKSTSNSARPFPRTGEIAIFANFTKSTGSFPPFFFCLFNLLRMVRLLHLELLRETLRTVSKPTTQLCSRISERSDSMRIAVLGAGGGLGRNVVDAA